ncbi:hypothetical protein QJQ58_29490 [Paenibacillus dendritiformis]|uniref:hypothetical protein n=1 Tax=Paenibacillus dendritiformis TaxID=130049 RepID=UPI00248C963D|nr:hypothetical protein [Paenibacillus dendritiformis]WGU94570.1 hypothetical protein QJQ58_29490 [Paenibacillus dendritiformis]
MHNLDVAGRDGESAIRAGERALIQSGRHPINGKRDGKHPVANESKGNLPVPGNLSVELGRLGLVLCREGMPYYVYQSWEVLRWSSVPSQRKIYTGSYG